MKLGLFTPVLGGLNVKQMLAKVRALGAIQAIELAPAAGRGAITSIRTCCPQGSNAQNIGRWWLMRA